MASCPAAATATFCAMQSVHRERVGEGDRARGNRLVGRKGARDASSSKLKPPRRALAGELLEGAHHAPGGAWVRCQVGSLRGLHAKIGLRTVGAMDEHGGPVVYKRCLFRRVESSQRDVFPEAVDARAPRAIGRVVADPAVRAAAVRHSSCAWNYSGCRWREV